MSRIILFNKPYGVVCQFTPDGLHPTLKDYISTSGVYAAGRLDTDSEGLLLLTDDGPLQHQLSHPRHKQAKTYWAQVEGSPTQEALALLCKGVDLGDFITAPAKVRRMDEPANLWPRIPPIRYRKNIPASWLEIIIEEGKNRQVRRMTAKAGHPTLRLIRLSIGPYSLTGLQPGQWQEIEVPPQKGISLRSKARSTNQTSAIKAIKLEPPSKAPRR